MAKIISISKFNKTTPLTPLMTKALRLAWKKQSNDKPIGQIDLNGSFTALLKREFIDAKTISLNGRKEVLWYVTNAGIRTLNKLGYQETC